MLPVGEGRVVAGYIMEEWNLITLFKIPECIQNYKNPVATEFKQHNLAKPP